MAIALKNPTTSFLEKNENNFKIVTVAFDSPCQLVKVNENNNILQLSSFVSFVCINFKLWLHIFFFFFGGEANHLLLNHNGF